MQKEQKIFKICISSFYKKEVKHRYIGWYNLTNVDIAKWAYFAAETCTRVSSKQKRKIEDYIFEVLQKSRHNGKNACVEFTFYSQTGAVYIVEMTTSSEAEHMSKAVELEDEEE